MRREFKNRVCREEIDGVLYRFDSQFEYQWAKYLHFLHMHDEIQLWTFHPTTFDFWPFGYRNKPYEYTPDFGILENDGTRIFQECKGYIETKDLSRMRRANKHFEAVFDLVLQRYPKRGRMTQTIAKAKGQPYIRRIIDAQEIFKQTKGVIK